MDEEFWVFGYGSLMWRPGFRPAEKHLALIHGYHRAMCVVSHTYRGTKRRPGLVLGLDRGGSCHGVAMRVPKAKAAKVASYLRRREMHGNVYTPRTLHARLPDGRVVSVLAYVARRDHAFYAGDMPPAKKAEWIRVAAGSYGTARAYLENTIAHLESLGVADRSLHRLLALVDGATATRADGRRRV